MTTPTETKALVERLRDVSEWKAIIEKYRRKTGDPSITYVLQDGTRIHEDESSVAKLAASLSRALESASDVAMEAAAALEPLTREPDDGTVEVDGVVNALCDLLEFHARMPIGVAVRAEEALGRYYQKYPPNRPRAAIAALARRNAMREAPSEPGGFVGDIFYGNPERSTEGTHRWTGSEWVRLPTDAEALTTLLAKSRKKAEMLRASLRDTLDFLERHSNRWDGVNGKHPQVVVTEARAALTEEPQDG